MQKKVMFETFFKENVLESGGILTATGSIAEIMVEKTTNSINEKRSG